MRTRHQRPWTSLRYPGGRYHRLSRPFIAVKLAVRLLETADAQAEAAPGRTQQAGIRLRVQVDALS
jgi:hypothetical protein